MTKVDEEFEKKLKDVKDYVALATVDAGKYQKTNLGIIKHLTDKSIPGVYVTLNKPFKTMENVFKGQKIDTEIIIFIDAVTQTAGGDVEKTDKCLFIGSPDNLSDISIAMDQAVRALPSKDKFVFFDSLSTLLIYNNIETVSRFIHFLASKMRVWKVRGIIVSLRKEQDKALIDALMQFCDVVLDFEAGK
jgi:KaiC/GvpD/RAD55 family RecA-like ATPase